MYGSHTVFSDHGLVFSPKEHSAVPPILHSDAWPFAVVPLLAEKPFNQSFQSRFTRKCLSGELEKALYDLILMEPLTCLAAVRIEVSRQALETSSFSRQNTVNIRATPSP